MRSVLTGPQEKQRQDEKKPTTFACHLAILLFMPSTIFHVMPSTILLVIAPSTILRPLWMANQHILFLLILFPDSLIDS